MGWHCDICGGPHDPWSGGQNEPYRCLQGCTESDPKDRHLIIKLIVSEALVRDEDFPLEKVLGKDAAHQARKLVAARSDDA